MLRFFITHPGSTMIAILLTVFSLWFVWAPEVAPWLVLSNGTGATPYPFSVITNGFVDVGSSVFGFFLLIFIAGYVYQSRLRRLWRRSPVRLVIGGLLVGTLLHLVNHYIFKEQGWGYFSAVLVALWIGSSLEDRWGTSRMLTFSTLILLITQALGLLVLWVVPSSREQYLGGAHPLFNGWMTALCLMYGRQRIAGLNVTAKSLIWVLVILDGLALLLDGSLVAGMGLAGILIAWLLMTGRWHPSGLLDTMRLYLLKLRLQARRRRFRVIDGNKKD